jgi:CRP/FNR family transcriptional regulator, cyclic AMP receptor protein
VAYEVRSRLQLCILVQVVGGILLAGSSMTSGIAARERSRVRRVTPLGGSPQRAWPNRIGAMRLFSQDTKVQALKGVPLFEGLSRKELVQLERVCEDVQVEPGKVLCKEGQTGDEFFVIVDGRVQVTRKSRHVSTLSSGDFVGEIALVTEMPRTATVTAETPVRLIVLTRREFHAMLDQNPKVERKVLRVLARRLAETSSDPKLA